MKFIETQLVQREFDGRWELIGKYRDVENTYVYGDEKGQVATLVPEKWITINVYDFIMEEVKNV